MEPNTPQENPINTPIQSMVDGARRDGTAGPLIGSIIIILTILIGGLYFWGSIIIERKNQIETQEAVQDQAAEAETAAITSQSTSDESTSIEADLNATNIDSVDADIEAVDSEY
jgi:hypothetical protein